MTTRRLLVSAIALSLHAIAFGGPLSPPGAPAPTMKTLDEIEPSIPIGPLTTPGDSTATYIITQPGAYHLTEHLIGESGKHGIVVGAAKVTIDLRGFTLFGVTGSGSGITYPTVGQLLSTPNEFTLRDGAIYEWDGHGVRLLTAIHVRIERVVSQRNGGHGFWLGERAQVSDCMSELNGEAGFEVEPFSVIERCVSYGDGGVGFDAPASRIADCFAYFSGSDGFRGVQTTYSSCIAGSSAGHGFNGGAVATNCFAGGAALTGFLGVRRVADCVAEQTGGDGFAGGFLATGCAAYQTNYGFANFNRVENCTIEDTAGGILLPVGGSVADCTIVGGPTSISPALVMNDSTSAIGCTITDSASHGIRGTTSAHVRVEGCTITNSAAEGIRLNGQDVWIADTIIRDSVGGGIEVLGQRATIDNCRIENPGGTGIAGGDDLVVRRTVVTNTAGAGISGGVASVIEECTIRSVPSSGIIVQAASSVVNNLIQNVARDAVDATRQCRIEGNHIDLAGTEAGFNGAGVLVRDVSNRIHNNNITRCDWAIRTSTGFNAITENSYSGWFIGATNLAPGNTLGTNYAH